MKTLNVKAESMDKIENVTYIDLRAAYVFCAVSAALGVIMGAWLFN